MIDVGAYKMHRRAASAFNQLDADEQGQVVERLNRLVEAPSLEWPSAEAKRLPGEAPLYLVHVNDSLRVIVQAANGHEPEVMDIVRRETLEFFGKSAGKSE